VGAHPGVVHQQGDAGVPAQHVFHGGQRGRLVQVGHQHLDRAAGAVADVARQVVQALAVAGHQHQVVAAAGQAVGVEGADARGGAGDEGGARVEEVMSMLRWVATWQGRRVAMEASSVRWVMSQMTYIVMF
jgi:hypothetical protein